MEEDGMKEEYLLKHGWEQVSVANDDEESTPAWQRAFIETDIDEAIRLSEEHGCLPFDEYERQRTQEIQKGGKAMLTVKETYPCGYHNEITYDPADKRGEIRDSGTGCPLHGKNCPPTTNRSLNELPKPARKKPSLKAARKKPSTSRKRKR